MKKVVFIDQFGTIGGGQVVGLEILRIFVKLGWQTTAAFPLGDEFERRARMIAGVEVLDFPELALRHGPKGLADIMKTVLHSRHILKFLPQIKAADVVYVNGPRLFPVFYALSFFINKKFIYHIHLDHSRGQKRLIKRLLLAPNTARIIVNSHFTRDQLVRFDKAFQTHPRVQLIMNSLTHGFAELPFREPELYGEDLRFVTVGRISAEKGQGAIIDLAKRFPDQKFYLVGAPDFAENKFEKHLRENSPANVIFSGKTLNVPEFIRENKISGAIVPSQVSESFGLVAIEGMAASCATIMSHKGELSNIAKKTGGISFRDQNELEKEVRKLIELSKPELTALVKSQYEMTHQIYSPQRFENEIEQLVGELSK